MESSAHTLVAPTGLWAKQFLRFTLAILSTEHLNVSFTLSTNSSIKSLLCQPTLAPISLYASQFVHYINVQNLIDDFWGQPLLYKKIQKASFMQTDF